MLIPIIGGKHDGLWYEFDDENDQNFIDNGFNLNFHDQYYIDSWGKNFIHLRYRDSTYSNREIVKSRYPVIKNWPDANNKLVRILFNIKVIEQL